MATKILLINDVESHGRKGEVISVRPGFFRNFLLPQGLAVIANKQTLRHQEKLKEERHQLALQHKKESEEVAARIEGTTLTFIVKVDHEGHMYGSVSSLDIIQMLNEQHKLDLDKRCIVLKHPVKEMGIHTIPVKLKEGVSASFYLKVISEEGQRIALAEEAKQS